VTAKAAADAKGPEVILSDDDNKPINEVTSTMMMKPRKVGKGNARQQDYLRQQDGVREGRQATHRGGD
jgi:hypothetical protein